MRFPSVNWAAVLVAAALAGSCVSLEGRARDTLNAPGIEGTRWGLVVTTMDGRELVAIRPDERFMPASNTKLFTVAAAFHRLANLEQPDPSAGASVRIELNESGAPDIVLVGGGDAMLIDADDCERNCLSDLANMVVANRITRVRNVIGDDTLFPHERWGPGWTQEDMQFRAGAPASALVVNSNEVVLQIKPNAEGQPVDARWRDDDGYFHLVNQAVTVSGDEDRLRIERLPGSNTVRLFGHLGASRPAQTIPLAVEDPALAAAWRLKRLLEEQGVVIEGVIEARHRPLSPTGEPAEAHDDAEIARLLPPPLIDDMRFLMKRSQNLHAEVLLRRLGRLEVVKLPEQNADMDSGSRARGLHVVKQMLDEAGADPAAWDLSDGSGMSTYNRVTPRMVAKFLHWTSLQPWGERFRATLPVGGIDGTLSRRFKGTSLDGRIFAKTGTLKGTNALSGFMLARSEETLIFSAYANDRPEEAGSATTVLDQALVAIAESR